MKSVLTALALSAAASSAQAADITAQPTTHFIWERTPEGVAFAPLEGDRFAEAYMAMVELPAGLVSPAHIKSATMFGVVTQGTFVHQIDGETSQATELGVGSYYKIPAGVAHVSKCISEVPCVTFVYQDGPFDFLPVPQ